MQKSLVTKEATINYTVSGEGANVVLIHGFGEDSAIWDQQVEHLKSFCRLIVPDLPGSGPSVVTDPQNADTIEFYSTCIYQLMVHEAITGAIVLGHSMGGYIALCFAEQHPEMLRAFGLVHSTAFADSPEKKEIRNKAIGTIETYGAYAFLKTTIPNLFGSTFKKNHPGTIDALIGKGNNFSVRSLQQYYRAMMNRPDRTRVLKNSDVPVLFVIGTEDGAAPMQDVLKQVALPTQSHVHILEHCGHMGMLEEPDKLNRILEAFIKQIG